MQYQSILAGTCVLTKGKAGNRSSVGERKTQQEKGCVWLDPQLLSLERSCENGKTHPLAIQYQNAPH